tara:strand:+ start:21337 stop:21795 length:459 start_codon:yes stop_codon:yes gene_type:complete
VVEFKKPTPEMIQFIADNMRQADVDEVMAAANSTPLQAITGGIEISYSSSVAVINGDIVAIMGVVKNTALSSTGVPWLLGTEAIVKHYREFLGASPSVLNAMINVCPNLVNHVYVENKVSIRWLKWLGFKIEEAKPFGVNGKLFHKFTIGNP